MQYVKGIVKSHITLYLFVLFTSFSVFSATKSPQYPSRYVESGQYVVKLKQVMQDQAASTMLTQGMQEEGEKLNISSATQTGGFPGFRLKSMFPRMQAKALASRSLQDKQNASPLSRTYLMFMPESTMLRDDVLNIVASLDDVEAVEPVFIRSTGEVKTNSDSDSSNVTVTIGSSSPTAQYHLESFQLPDAQEFLESQGVNPGGSEDVVVAVIDTGLDIDHPEFEGRLWVNSDEIPGNGRDDDRNGVVDDVNGANFVGDDATNDIRDFNGHGTHVAGIIGANDDGRGVTGIAPNVQLMIVRASQTNGRLLSSDIAESIIYAHENGADVINMSFGGTVRSFLELDALTQAFSSSVLVASAGNNGSTNNRECAIAVEFEEIYPASYDYVLGVMAHDQNNTLALFSNRDCIVRDLIEYELAAPGVSIVSTVPNEGFAGFDGTSQAAPMVSGAAALARSFYNDRTLYTSRFIMGQLVGNASLSIMNRSGGGEAEYPEVQLLQSLTQFPLPDLSVVDSHVFDSNSLNSANDVDGRIDAGETVELGVTLKNHWGSASNVRATLIPRPTVQGSLDDPFVDVLVGEIEMGDIGNFATLNNLVLDELGEPLGLSPGFVVNISSDTPNNYILTFSILITAIDGNGQIYTEELDEAFELSVNRGQALPVIVREDMVLTPDRLWLVETPVLIQEGVTVTVEAGTQIQFFTSDPDTPQTGQLAPRLQVDGSFIVKGSAAEPVRIFPSSFHSGELVEISRTLPGTVDMEFVEIVNPNLNGNIQRVDHASVSFNSSDGFSRDRGNWNVFNTTNTAFRNSHDIEFFDSRFRSNFNFDSSSNSRGTRAQIFQHNLFDGIVSSAPDLQSVFTGLFTGQVEMAHIGNVFLRNLATRNNALPNTIEPRQLGSNRANLSTLAMNNVGRPAINESFFFLEPLHFDGKTYVMSTWDRAGLPFFGLFPENHIRTNILIGEALGGHPVSLNTDTEYSAVFDYAFAEARKIIEGEYDNECGGSCETVFPTLFNFLPFFTSLSGMEPSPTGVYSWTTGESDISPLFRENYFDSRFFGSDDFRRDESFPLFLSLDSGIGNDEDEVGPTVRVPDFSIFEIEGRISKSEIERRFTQFEETTYHQFYDNAILNYWWSTNPQHWLRILSTEIDTFLTSSTHRNNPGDIRLINRNYWGAATRSQIQQSLLDFNAGNFDGFEYVFDPVLDTPPENTFPFVADVKIDTQATSDVTQFGVEPITVTLTFNRDMDRSVQPGVFFAPNAPYTDREVLGDWISDRQWQAQYDVPPTIEGGFQYLSVFNAVSEDDPWLRSGNDFARFRFLVSTSGTLSTSQLNAQNLAEGVLVEWDIDNTNFNVINIFRSTDPNDNFRLVHRTYRNSTDNTFVDTSVTDNTEYFYQLSVGLDGEETLVSQTARIVRDSTDVSDPDDGNPGVGGGTLAVPFDFDGDGAADVAVRRPSNFMQFIRNSSDEGIQRIAFGRNPNDIPISGDFDGDGITDVGVRRASNQTWFILNSSGQDLISGNADGITRMRFGLNAADIPVPADYDGDGITDLAVRRPSNQTWFVRNSSGVDEVTGNSDGITRFVFGRDVQDIPVVADYDGDGRADFAVRRPSTQMWFIHNSSGVDVLTGFNDGISRRRFGTREEDIPVPADFDGDGRADLAVRRPSTESWFVLNSSGSNFNSGRNDGIQRVTFGRDSADIPIVGDYDGDGIADFAVRRPSTQMQFILRSSDNEVDRIQFGLQASDIPLAAPIQTRMQMASRAQ